MSYGSTYILRDVRRFIAELIFHNFSPNDIYATDFGQYISQQLWDTNVKTPFRDSYYGSNWIYLENYEIVYKIWEFLYFIRSRGLYNMRHSSMMRVMSMVHDTIDMKDIEYVVNIIFRMKRIREEQD